jgi:hypothetical protein
VVLVGQHRVGEADDGAAAGDEVDDGAAAGEEAEHVGLAAGRMP